MTPSWFCMHALKENKSRDNHGFLVRSVGAQQIGLIDGVFFLTLILLQILVPECTTMEKEWVDFVDTVPILSF